MSSNSLSYHEGMERVERLVGVTIGSVAAVASISFGIWVSSQPVLPGESRLPALLVSFVSGAMGLIGAWAWAHKRWLIAAPTLLLSAVGSVIFLSFFILLPIVLALIAAFRAIRGVMSGHHGDCVEGASGFQLGLDRSRNSDLAHER